MDPASIPPIRTSARAAIRSNSLQHVDIDTETAFSKEVEKQQTERDKEYATLKNIAALDDHPGWKLLKESMLQQIEDYRSGRAFDKAHQQLKEGKITYAEYGQLVFQGYEIADQLTVLINSVNVTKETVNQVNEEERNAAIAARRFMGSPTQREG